MHITWYHVLVCLYVVQRSLASTDGQMAIPSKKPGFNSIFQTDIDKEVQREVNTLKSQVDFFSDTLENVLKENKDLKTDISNLKSNFDDATDQLQKLENTLAEARQNISQQNLNYADLLKQKKQLEQILASTNERLTNRTNQLTSNVTRVTAEIDNLANTTAYSINQVIEGNNVLKTSFKELSRNQTLINAQIGKRRGVSDEDRSAFLVRLSADRSFWGRGIVINFDKVEFNIDMSYSPLTGIFTAPESGLFTFSATFEASKADISAAIVKNNEQISSMYGADNDRNKIVATTSTYVHLNEGDEVWMEWTGSGSTMVKGGIYSQFTGHFVMSD
ncbi:hypothetical protein FSP39_017065 [Pinctada imbricata]|uniref:C1q domain-containing protein n=1 Tax=Pinctada imbricata TaxID=66713 RepID=A0AA88XW22_PINIB|nr:hypothetical protein FSP39_017065 [Pinctada imbricata]